MAAQDRTPYIWSLRGNFPCNFAGTGTELFTCRALLSNRLRTADMGATRTARSTAQTSHSQLPVSITLVSSSTTDRAQAADLIEGWASHVARQSWRLAPRAAEICWWLDAVSVSQAPGARELVSWLSSGELAEWLALTRA